MKCATGSSSDVTIEMRAISLPQVERTRGKTADAQYLRWGVQFLDENHIAEREFYLGRKFASSPLVSCEVDGHGMQVNRPLVNSCERYFGSEFHSTRKDFRDFPNKPLH